MKRRIAALLACGALGLTAAPALDAQTFIRGDANGDNALNIADSVTILTGLYPNPSSPPPGPLTGAADVNDNGFVEIADAAYQLRAFFELGSPPPPAPFPAAGLDTTPPNFPTLPTGALEFRLAPTNGCPGVPASMSFHITNSDAVEALNIRVQFDTNDLSYAGVDTGTLDLLLGNVPAFVQEVVTGDIVTIGTVFNFISPNLSGLQPQADTPIINLLFDLQPTMTIGSTTTVTLANDPSMNPANVNLGSVLGQVEIADLVGNGTITVVCGGEEFLRGDHNEDNSVSISDAVHIVNYLFQGGAVPGCERTGDTNADNLVNIADVVFLLSALFDGSTSIPAPFPVCAMDPGGSSVTCAAYAGSCP